MKKVKKFLTIPLIMVLFLSNTLLSYARTEWTFEEKLRYFEDNFSSFLSNTVGFVVGENDADVIYHSLVSLYEQKVMEANDVTYQEWLLNHLGFDFDNNNNVLGVEVDPVVINIMNDGVNEFVKDNPLGYSIQNIYSYKNIRANYFPTQTAYTNFNNKVSSLTGTTNFIFVPFYNGTNNQYLLQKNGSNYQEQACGFMWYNKPLQFYCSAGHVNNFNYLSSFKPTYNWTYTKPYYLGSYNAKVKTADWNIWACQTDGTVRTVNSSDMFGYDPGETFSNSNGATNQSGWGIFNTSDRTMKVYLYDSINAMRVHDTGNPAPYYYSSNYKGSDYTASEGSFLNTGSIENSGNTYEEITENITTGMTAEEVIQLVDTIMKNNNDKPWSPPSDDSGGGGSDSDGIWGSIGSALGKLFGALGDFILGLINGLLDKVEELIDSIKGIFDKLTDLVPNVIGDLFSSLFSWLPEEFTTLITASIGLIVIFGIIRMIRG